MSDRLLVLVRHGESEWNKKNLFTGWRDVGLTEKGIAEAETAGRKLKAQGIRFDAIQGLSDPLVRFAAAAPLWAGAALPRLMARRMGSVPNLGSTLQSIRRGRLTEVDYFNGAVVAESARVGLRAPVNAAVTDAVHEVERTGRFFAPDELARLVASRTD